MRGSEMHKIYFRVKNLFINRALSSAEIHLTCRKWFKLSICACLAVCKDYIIARTPDTASAVR